MPEASERSPWDAWLAWAVSNPLTKVLSFLLAMGLWLYVQGDEVHEVRLQAQLAWVVPPDLVSTEELPKTALLRVRGTRAATRRAREAVLRLPIDLSDRGIGDHGIELATLLPEQSLPPSLQLIGIEPSMLRFTLDEEAVRKVSVEAELVGEPAEGHVVVEVEPEPAIVDVRGPRTTVESLREVRTEPIDVSGLAEDAIRDVRLALPRGVQLASGVIPTASIRVVPEIEQRTLAAIPVYTYRHRDYQPEIPEVQVTLRGPSVQLRGVRPDRVVAVVHLPDEPERRRYEAFFGPQEGVRVEIVHPGGDAVEVTAVMPTMVSVVRP